MFKLLTPEQKKKIEGEYARRRLIVFIFALNCVMLLGIVSLFPTYALMITRKSAVTQLVKSVSHSTASSTDAELKNWADSVNKTLVLLAPTTDNDKPYEYFVEVINSKTQGIYIDRLTWDKGPKSVSVSVAGISKDRQALLDFEGKLNSSSKFTSTNFPVSDLAQGKDINFQFSLTPAP